MNTNEGDARVCLIKSFDFASAQVMAVSEKIM